MKSFLTSLAGTTARFARRAWAYAHAHKIITGIAAVAVLGGGYWAYQSYTATTTTTQYVLAQATEAPIQSVVTASGEVAASHQLDLSPKASGTVTSVRVTAGDSVAAGTVIATIDSTDAVKSVRDAELSLESAQISYSQAVTSANNTITNGSATLDTARDSGFDAVSSAQNNLNTILQGLNTLLYSNSDVPGHMGSPTGSTYERIIESNAPSAQTSLDTASASYKSAQASYDATFTTFQQASRTSSPEDIQTLLAQERETAAKTNQAVKDAQAFFALVQQTVTAHDLLTQPPSIASQISTLSSYTSTAQSTASSLASAQSSLTTAQQNEAANTSTMSGAPLSIRSAQLTLAKAQASLADARDTLANYVVVAPFPGTIAKVNVQKYDSASSGTAVATLITKEQYADISLNETDIAAVKVGQKATLTFDAIDGLTIDGTVASVDQTGTVSQGVATYTVKVGFDSQDARVKPGMTVNATIITASKDTALVIPTSALKTRGTEYYVEVVSKPFVPTTSEASTTNTSHATFPSNRSSSSTANKTETVAAASVTVQRVPVTIGIQSDTMTEITSGLNPGEQVVSESLNATGQSTTQSKGIFSLFGGGTRTGSGTGLRTTSGTSRTGTTNTTSAGAGGFTGGPPPGG